MYWHKYFQNIKTKHTNILEITKIWIIEYETFNDNISLKSLAKAYDIILIENVNDVPNPTSDLRTTANAYKSKVKR